MIYTVVGGPVPKVYFRLEGRWLNADPASDLVVLDDLALDSALEAIFPIRREVTDLRATLLLTSWYRLPRNEWRSTCAVLDVRHRRRVFCGCSGYGSPRFSGLSKCKTPRHSDMAGRLT